MGCGASKNVTIVEDTALGQEDKTVETISTSPNSSQVKNFDPVPTVSELNRSRVKSTGIAEDEQINSFDSTKENQDVISDQVSSINSTKEKHDVFSDTLSDDDSRYSELLEIEDSLAAATVIDVLQNVTTYHTVQKEKSERQNSEEVAVTENQEEQNAPPRKSSALTLGDHRVEAVVGEIHSAPVPSGQPTRADAASVDVSHLFNNALRKACTITKNENLISLAKNSRSLKLERSFLCFGESKLLSKIVAEMANLTVLDMSGGLCGPVTFRAIVFALINDKHIKSLDLSDNMTNPDCSESLGKLISCNKVLEYLNVSSNHLGKEALSRHIGTGLRENVSLKSLNISSCGATDLHCLCESIRNYTGHSLNTLIASHNHITDGYQFAIDVSLILESENCHLTDVDITDVAMTSPGMKTLIASISLNKTLESLKVGRNQVENIFSLGELILNASRHPRLKELILSKMSLENDVSEDHDFICESSSPSQLTHLHLADCNLNTQVLEKLNTVLNGRLSNVVDLDISLNNELSCGDIKLFDQMCNGKISSLKIGLYEHASEIPNILSSGFSEVRSLDLRKSKLNQAVLKEIATESVQCFDEINLSGIKLSGFSVLEICLPCSSFSNLKVLYLSGCLLNDTDMEPLNIALGKEFPLLGLTDVDLSVNRITSAFLIRFVESMLIHRSHPLTDLNLSNNNIDGDGIESLSLLFTTSTHRTNINKLNLSCNSISAPSVCTFMDKFEDEYTLVLLDLRNQKESYGEDDIEIMANKMKNVFFRDDSKEDKFTIYLTGLGGTDVPLLCSMDSCAIRTDFVNLRKPSITLNDAFEIAKGLEIIENSSLTTEPINFTSHDWKSIVGKEAPSWVFVASELQKAAYIFHMPGTVTLQRLQALLEMEADCSVKDIYLITDPVVRKPTGAAWVLFSDVESLTTAVDWYITGCAQMYGTPFIVSAVRGNITDENIDTKVVAEKEMARRELEQKKKAEEDRRLLDESQNLATERAEYREAHPAYQNGRIS